MPPLSNIDAETLRRGLNFTFTTDIGDLDLPGEVRGVGHYEDTLAGSVTVELFGYRFAVIDIAKLIVAKRAAGRPKDLIALPELEAIQEAQAIEGLEEAWCVSFVPASHSSRAHNVTNPEMNPRSSLVV